MESDNYVEELRANLDNIPEEFRDSVKRLIEERDFLVASANLDPLTGAYNRRILENIRDFNVVAMCDIDDFKTINDTFGHQAGDEVLKTVSSILKENSRSTDFVCRYGGDEFLVVFSVGNERQLKQRMEIVSQAFTESMNLPGYQPTLSFGIASYEDGMTLEGVIKEADDALYVSKGIEGKNTITVYDEAFHKKR